MSDINVIRKEELAVSNRIGYVEEWAKAIKPLYRDLKGKAWYLICIPEHDLKNGNFAVPCTMGALGTTKFKEVDESKIQPLLYFEMFSHFATYNFPRVRLVDIYEFILNNYSNEDISKMDSFCILKMDTKLYGENKDLHKLMVVVFTKKNEQ